MDCIFSWLYRGRMTNLWSPDDDLCYDIIANLPLELAQHILRQLDVKSLRAAMLVNRKWLRIIKSDRILRQRLREAKRSYWRSVAKRGFVDMDLAKLPKHLRANLPQFVPKEPVVRPTPVVFQPQVLRPQPAVLLETRKKGSTGPVKSVLKASAKQINKVLGSRPSRLRF